MARMITVILFTGILIGCGPSRPEPQQVQTARRTSFESKVGPRRVQPARMSIKPPRGLIAFTSYRRGAAMIHVLKADGSQMKLLQLGNGASWSPDAKRIAFVQFYNDTNRFEIVVMNADGANLKRLTKSAAEDSTHPQWSRDAGRLVLQSGNFNKPRIYVMTPESH